MTDGALRVRGFHKTFRIRSTLGQGSTTLRAVDDVSFDIPKGMSLGLVGESGCGKSTAARCVLRLLEPTQGEIVFDGKDLRALPSQAMRDMRRRMQIVFQDPYASLNPRRTIRQTLEEPLHVRGGMGRREIAEKAEATLAEVGLPMTALDRYPHEFSGGQRQRVGIARVLVLDPDLIVADEPVSALDVSVQAQVPRLLGGLREKRGLSFLFVSHDLGVIRHFCDRTAVMYLGRVVEEGPTKQVLDNPGHHYTRLLMASSPVPDPRARVSLPKVTGELPPPSNPPTGCVFHPRCSQADNVCSRERPPLANVWEGRRLACFHPVIISDAELTIRQALDNLGRDAEAQIALHPRRHQAGESSLRRLCRLHGREPNKPYSATRVACGRGWLAGLQTEHRQHDENRPKWHGAERLRDAHRSAAHPSSQPVVEESPLLPRASGRSRTDHLTISSARRTALTADSTGSASRSTSASLTRSIPGSRKPSMTMCSAVSKT